MSSYTSGYGLSRRELAVIFAGITAFLNIYGLQTLLPTLSQSLAVSHQAISLTISATTLAVALFSPWAGLITARLQRRKQIGMAVLGLTLCGLGGALCSGLSGLLLSRFLLGLFLPLLVNAVMAMIAEEWKGPELGRGTSLYIASTVIGGFIGRFLTGLLGAWLGWRAAVGMLALINGLSGWFLLKQLRPSSTLPSRSMDLREFGRAWRLEGIPQVLAIGFQILFCLVGVFSYISFHLAGSAFHLGPAALGSLSCVYLIGGSITPFANRLFARWGYAGSLRFTSAVAVLGILLTGMPHLALVILGLTLCSTATFISQAAAAMGLYLSFYYLGGCAGAALPGFFWTQAGWPACMALFVAFQLNLGRLARRLQ